MTRMRGGSVSPPDPTRSPVDSERPPFNVSKLPSKAPDVIAKNTIPVSDPARVLPWNKSERQRDFNLLVRRYINQLLYGCQDPNCTTPTCFSYRRRVTDGPLRKLTELSARTVACYLASQDNPENGLCRNEPAIRSDFHSPGGSRKANKRPFRPRSPSTEIASEATSTTMVDQNGNGNSRASSDPSVEAEGSQNRSTTTEFADMLSSPASGEKQGEVMGERKAQHMKDPKSFTQNLFDTLSLRMVEWLPLRRPREELDPSSNGPQGRSRQSKREDSSFSDSQTSSGGKRRSNIRKQNSSTGVSQSKSQHPPTPSTTSHPAALELKLPGPPVKRLSLSELEPKRQTPRSSLEEKTRPDRGPVRKLSLNTHSSANSSLKGLQSPSALKSRSQKHRHLNGDINGPRQAEQKKHRRVSWDGSKRLKQSQRKENQPKSESSTSEAAPQAPENHERRQKPIIPQNKEGEGSVQLAQSLSHLSKDIVDGLGQMMFDSDEDVEHWKDEMAAMETLGKSELCDWKFSSTDQRQAFAFISQSMFYVLSSPDQLLQSFRKADIETGEEDSSRPMPSIDMAQLDDSFRNLYLICPWPAAMHNLWVGLERLFIPPPELSPSMRHQRRGSRSKTPDSASSLLDESATGYISDEGAAHILTITLFALVNSIPRLKPKTWQMIRQIRASGTALPDADIRKQPHVTTKLLVDVTDRFEHDLALRLVNRLVRAIAARLAFHEISKARSLRVQDPEKQGKTSTMDLILENLRRYHALSESNPHHSVNFSDPHGAPSASALAVEWLRTLLLKEWDGKPETTKSGPVGGAIQILSSMYKDRARLGLLPEHFHTSFLSERLDPMETPIEWLEVVPNNKTLHLLSYSFLFPPSAVVTYFRALNYATMSKSYESAMTASRHVTQTAFSQTIPVYDDVSLLARLKTSMSTYLVLSVRREDVLTDALDQLWRREKRELMRPLKVQMGMQEGEEGIDHGGVQQEFFRVVMAEALDPSFGLFTTDSRTRISWFQPCSLEPLYKFELLGLLTSLAIYNGLTLPVNFPIALYRKLLGLKVKKLDHIRVGWEDLAKGLDDLLAWDDGDVGDIFMRTYEFSFEAFGSIVAVNMESVGRDDEWPLRERGSIAERTENESPRLASASSSRRGSGTSKGVSMLLNDSNTTLPEPRNGRSGILKGAESKSRKAPVAPSPAEEAPLVTNDNRQQFVKDYIFWLTDKSIRPQYEAFARGFYTCLDQTALSIFTPEALKSVVEGIQEFDINELENHTRYDGGFEPTQRVIRDFWDVVRQYPQDKKAQLLEFVTASDRVPVNGIGSIMFVIQKNGVGDDRLPTSLTCFGRLLLPEYSSREVLEEKLGKALENAQGFGVA